MTMQVSLKLTFSTAIETHALALSIGCLRCLVTFATLTLSQLEPRCFLLGVLRESFNVCTEALRSLLPRV